MELFELISAESILVPHPPPTEKEALLQEMLRHLLGSHSQEADFEEIWQLLLAREASMSTGIGDSVAIPHCSTDRVEDIEACMALLPSGIEFAALDGRPVQIVVLMLMPKNQFDRHIKTLATVARTLNNPDSRATLLGADSPAEAHQVLRGLVGAPGGRRSTD